MMAENGVIDSVFFAMGKIWNEALEQSYEPMKLRRGYWELYLGEWTIRKYVWGKKVRYEIDGENGSSYIEKVGDTYKSHGSWDVLQEFLIWAEMNNLL